MSEGMLPKDVSNDLLNDILGGGKLDKLLGLRVRVERKTSSST